MKARACERANSLARLRVGSVAEPHVDPARGGRQKAVGGREYLLRDGERALCGREMKKATVTHPTKSHFQFQRKHRDKNRGQSRSKSKPQPQPQPSPNLE
jgi:hypothetical protein